MTWPSGHLTNPEVFNLKLLLEMRKYVYVSNAYQKALILTINTSLLITNNRVDSISHTYDSNVFLQ